MPKSAFNAIENNIRHFLGGAKVVLSERGKGDAQPEPEDPGEFVIQFEIDKVDYLFHATRRRLAFTATEKSFIRELMTAFVGLLSGFSAEGFVAHFRTALLTSLTDIAVARYISAARKGTFWPAQSLIQVLKSLSYQRYEGSPATTAFLVYRTQLDEFLKSLNKTRYNWLDLGDNRRRIGDDFFLNPLSYRFVDGYRAIFIADIRMHVKGTIRTNAPAPSDNIDQLANREVVSLLAGAGEGAFVIYVNKASEVEIVLGNGKTLLWRSGYWGIFDPDIIREFLTGALDDDSIDDLIWTIYALSKARHGTVVLIADEEADLDSLSIGSVGHRDPLSRALIKHVCGTRISVLKRSGELSRILSSDGLTLFNRKGELLNTGVIIDTSKAHDLVTGGGRTTAANAASHFGRVIKVSEDGPVELYFEGRNIYRFG